MNRLKRIWHDPVWSIVIATLISAAILAGAHYLWTSRLALLAALSGGLQSAMGWMRESNQITRVEIAGWYLGGVATARLLGLLIYHGSPGIRRSNRFGWIRFTPAPPARFGCRTKTR